MCVIGLDGVPHSLLIDLAQKGVMPAFAELIESGHLHKLKASLPEISSVSWTDFMTGTNPGTHGIFGFTDLKPQTYELRFPNFLDVKTETFWDRIGQKNKKCIIINQPSTYPARRISGILISGFVAIELSKAVFPHKLKQILEDIRYEIDIDSFKAREDHEILWEGLNSTLAGRKRAFEVLWKEDWDYFEFVITGTDRLHHFVWDAYENSKHTYHQKFLDYYSQVDQLVYTIMSSFRKMNESDDGLYLLSDHGFTGIEQEVYLNVWLENEGYLKFDSAQPNNLADISPDAKAFAMDPNRIYLNLEDKFPQGCVSEAEKDSLKNEIKHKLENLECQGKKIVQKVFDTEDIYSGPYVSSGPDLIVLSMSGFDMKGSVKKKQIFDRSNLQGMHTWENAFFWAKEHKGDDLVISQLADIIMQNFE